MVQLVLTHGRSQEFGVPATLLREWEDALRYGLQRAKAPFSADIPISFAFYGDFWRPDAEEVERERGDEEQPTALQETLAEEMLAAMPPSEREEEVERLGWDSLNGMVTWLDERVGVGQLALQWFLTDIDRYFAEEALREQAMGRIVAAIEAAGDEVVLLGHSLGTVVAYDALRRHPDLPVRGYVSFGSPLGLPSVRRLLEETGGPADFPAHLPRWANVYDKNDFVTGNQPLAALYTADDGRAVEDLLSKGKRPSPLALVAAHDALVYLSSAPLGKAVRAMVEAAGGDPEAERGAESAPMESDDVFAGVESTDDSMFSAMTPPSEASRGEESFAAETERGGWATANRPGGFAMANGGGEEPERGAPVARGWEPVAANGGERDASGPPPGGGEPPPPPGDGTPPTTGVGSAAAQTMTKRVERAASADFPFVVPPGSVNTLRYQVGAKPKHAADTTLAIDVPVTAKTLDLTVAIQAADFEVLDPKTKKPSDHAPLSLDLDNAKAFAEGEFLLKAKETDEPTPSQIHVRFLHGNTPVGHIALPTIIAAERIGVSASAEEPRPAAIRYSPDAAPDPDIVIFVNRGSENTFEIAATRLGAEARDRYRQEVLNLGTLRVEGEPWRWAKEMLERFRLARELKNAERKERVENLGRELWRQLPPGFQRFYWDEIHGKDVAIAICSEEPYIPWELIKPERGSGKAAPILGTAFSIARWKADRDLPDPIVVSEFHVVAPSYENETKKLPAADLEANELVARFRAKRVTPGKRKQVLKLLKSKNLQVLHFSGHGKFGETPNDSTISLLDTPLDLIDLNSAAFADADDPHDPPLVFLNACEVGEQGWSLTQIGGWAEAFCMAGCAGFVGPYWAVNDTVARKAALLFYGKLQEGATVGEAMREVRRQFTADEEHRYHPTWLAYTLHCQPNVTVAFGR
jgi:pimeloyl-ACP methyl ester carboxylesterase